MKILHLFSGNLFTGAVEHAMELGAWQQQAGHEVWLGSDFKEISSLLPHTTIPVHNRKYLQRFRNIREVKKLIQQQDIQIVHAHSRAASAIANKAVKGTYAALVSTVHGRQHVHFSSKMFDVYGEKIIAVSEDIKQHLVTELAKPEEKITVIPNGLSFLEEATDTVPDFHKIAWIGRLSGPKGARASALFEKVFPQLLDRFPGLHIHIVGSAEGAIPENGDTHLKALLETFPHQVTVHGFLEDITPVLQNCGLIIGAGRVAIRALGSGKAVLALGESGCEGMVMAGNWEQAAQSNFGDTGIAEPNVSEKALAALKTFLGHAAAQQQFLAQRAFLQQAMARQYGLDAIAQRILQVYQEVRMRKLQPRWLPVLMYHKIPDAALDTPHRIFVTQAQFAKHLQWMAARKLSPVTFEDYEAVAKGARPARQWPKKPVILTFDDGYKSVLRNAFPAMQRRGWRGVLYVLADRSIRANTWDEAEREHPESALLTSEEIQTFVRTGWEIGGHTFTHPSLPELPATEQEKEVSASKESLEQEFGKKLLSFAYPFGNYNDEVVEAAKEAGYKYAVATDSGGVLLEDNHYRIFRVNIFPEETRFSLWKKTSAWYRMYYLRKRGK